MPQENKIRPEWEDDNYYLTDNSLRSLGREIYSRLDQREKLPVLTGIGGLAMLASGVVIRLSEHMGVDSSTVHLNEISNVLEGAGSAVAILSLLAFGTAVSDSRRIVDRENQEQPDRK